MGRFIFAFLTIVTASFSQAQTRATAQAQRQNPYRYQNLQTERSTYYRPTVSAKGFRVELLKPTGSATGVATKSNGRKEEGTSEMKDAMGFSLGYVSFPVESLGFATNLAYIQMVSGNSNSNLIRGEFSLGTAFSSMVSMKAGINVSTLPNYSLTDGRDSRVSWSVNPGIGYQIGIAIEANRNFGFDIGFVQMNQEIKYDYTDIGDFGQQAIGESGKISMRESGLQVGLHATF